MRDRNDWLNSERGTTSSNRQADKVLEPDAARSKGPWAGRYPTIIQTASPIGHSEVGATNAPTPVTGQVLNPNSHLARLANAVQRSRRLGAAPRRRQYLQLVQEERP